MQALEVGREADQVPLADHVAESSQRELAESDRLLDPTKDWLDDALSSGVDGSTFVALHPLVHSPGGRTFAGAIVGAVTLSLPSEGHIPANAFLLETLKVCF